MPMYANIFLYLNLTLFLKVDIIGVLVLIFKGWQRLVFLGDFRPIKTTRYRKEVSAYEC